MTDAGRGPIFHETPPSIRLEGSLGRTCIKVGLIWFCANGILGDVAQRPRLAYRAISNSKAVEAATKHSN